MERPDLEDLVLRVKDLPVVPAIAQKLFETLEDPDVSIDRVEGLIEKDPGLVARVLKVVNSSFYGYGGKIGTVKEAIVILGFKTLRSILLAASVKGIYKRFGPVERLIWEHSLYTAFLSKLVMEEENPSWGEDAFVCGILHNVGMVVMDNEYPERFREVTEGFYSHGIPLHEGEERVFGFNHRDVGALLVKRWRFPSFLEKVIRHQDEPEVFRGKDPYLYTLTKALYNGKGLCYLMGKGFGSRGRPRPARFLMKKEKVMDLMKKAKELDEGIRMEGFL